MGSFCYLSFPLYMYTDLLPQCRLVAFDKHHLLSILLNPVLKELLHKFTYGMICLDLLR